MLSLILPTYNEARNVERLIPLLEKILQSVQHEIIVVDDDSPDRTWEAAQRLGAQVIRRIGRRGLSSAVVEGFAAATGEVLAVMDADGQHDPALLPDLYRAVQAGSHLAVASRYAEGGSTRGWGGYRLILSRAATVITRNVPRVWVSDPMSGYFAVRRTIYRGIAGNLRPQGFKILLEILAHLPRGTRVAEVPLAFSKRWAGESKLSFRVQRQFAVQLLRVAWMRIRDFLWEAQWVVLFLAFAAVFVALLPAAWRLRVLAVDPAVRGEAEQALRTVVDREGWLLSDIEPVNATPYSLQFLHHRHRRGVDPVQCYILRFEPLTLIPCAPADAEAFTNQQPATSNQQPVLP